MVKANTDLYYVCSESLPNYFGKDGRRGRLETDSDAPTQPAGGGQGYADYNTRLASYYNGAWPSSSPVEPRTLAAAGLYYTGASDKVQCFVCKGKLFNWDKGDDPVKEHIRHFPKCTFVQNELLAQRSRGSSLHGRDPPGEHVEAATALAPRPTQKDWKDCTAVQAVLLMAYQESDVKRGFDILMRENKQLTTDALMDEIFKLEEEVKESASKTEDAGGSTGMISRRHNIEEAEGGARNSQETEPAEGGARNSPGKEQGAVGGLTEIEIIRQDLRKLNIPEEELTVDFQVKQEKVIESLQQQNDAMKSSTTCKICMDNLVGVVFLPCKHLVCCQPCGSAVKRCPVCRTFIQATVKTFIS